MLACAALVLTVLSQNFNLSCVSPLTLWKCMTKSLEHSFKMQHVVGEHFNMS